MRGVPERMLCTMWLLAAFAPRTLLAQDDEEDKVLVLGSSNFDDTIKANERMLVEFYAPWCGHCKQLEPEYKKAASTLDKEGLKTKLAKVDATAESELGNRFGVSGYPTLFYFVKGEHKSYEGPRDAAGISDYLRKREVPPVQVVKEEELESLLSSLESEAFAAVAHVKSKSARDKAFNAAVEQHLLDYSVSSLKFIAVKLPKAADPKKDAKLVLHRPGFPEDEGKLASFTGSWSADGIAKWVKHSTYQRIGANFNKKYYWPAVERLGWQGVVVICLDEFDADDEDAVEEDNIKPKVLEAITPMVEKYPKWKFTFCESGKLEENEKELLGVQDEPQISVVRGEKKKFVLKGASDIQDKNKVEKFLADVSAGALKPHYKSEPKPEPEKDEAGVTVLTGATFEEKVMNSKSDVFVEFYAPWCGHCKSLTPIWADLAKKSSKGWLGCKRCDHCKNGCNSQ